MKIKIKREGGFIGITSQANLKFDELTVEEQQAFNSLAEQSLQTAKPKTENPAQMETPPSPDLSTRAFGLLSTPIINEPVVNEPVINDQGLELAGNDMGRNIQNNQMRDGFSYSVSMRKDGKMMSMKFDDMTAPPEIVEIFQKYVQY